MMRIGRGDYRQHFAGSQVEELDHLGRELVRTGEQLGEAHDKILSQERLVSRALLRQRQFHDEQARFVRVMSHELRTPLSVIDSGAQIINRKASDLGPDALQKRAAKIRDAVRRISDLLQRLVSGFVPLEEQPDFGEVEPAPINGLVRAIATENVPEGRLSLLLPDREESVPDGTSLAIALRAVIDNALRYSPAGTSVTVSASVANGHAVISVGDCGPGIPEEELPLIGERFFRGSNATGTEGAGIGLYLARRSLETMGGSLSIESTQHGTIVTCTVPLLAALTDAEPHHVPAGTA